MPKKFGLFLFLSATRLLCAAEAKPNIVFLLVDDLGYGDFGCYGAEFYETPHIDKLAAEGMRFTNAYAACKVCSPSRAAILSGRYPARLHLTDWIAGHNNPKAKLEELGIAENTIIVLTGDNGGDHPETTGGLRDFKG